MASGDFLPLLSCSDWHSFILRTHLLLWILSIFIVPSNAFSIEIVLISGQQLISREDSTQFQAKKLSEVKPRIPATQIPCDNTLEAEHEDKPFNPSFGTDQAKLQQLYSSARELYDQGEYDRAHSLATEVLEIADRIGSSHGIADGFNLIGSIYYKRGNYDRSRDYQLKALKYAESVNYRFGSGRILSSIGSIYYREGNYRLAQDYYEKSLQVRRQICDIDEIARALNDLANVYYQLGDYAESLKLREEALRLWKLTANKVGIADVLEDIGSIYVDQGDYNKALDYLQQSLALSRDIKLQWTVAGSLDDIGLVYLKLRKYSAALEQFRESHAIFAALGNREEEAGTLHHIGEALYHLGDFRKAELAYKRALALGEKILGHQHPKIATVFFSLAALDAAQKKYRAALASYKKGLLILGQQIENIFAFTSEAQKLRYIQSVSGGYTACLSLIHQHLKRDGTAVRTGMEFVLHRKGIVLDAQSRLLEALRGRLPEAARQEFDVLYALRSELSHLLLMEHEQLNGEAYRKRLGTLQEQIRTLEQRLALENTTVAAGLRQRTLTVEEARTGLPPDSALVEFVKIRDYDFAGRKWKLSERYLAIVLTSVGSVELVELGDVAGLEATAQRMLQDLRNSLLPDPLFKERSHRSLKEFYAEAWAPLEKALGNANKVFVSPDGILNLVPFVALVDSQGRYLVERYRLAYVTSGRELVATGTPIQPDSDLLLVANPAYDKKGAAAGSPGASRRSRNFRGSFDPLPGTELEAKAIPPLVPGKSEKKRVVVGVNATESAVKAARSPRILHLATHGFFLEDEDLALDEKQRGQKGSASRYENPLVRSGLAFAGANHAAESTGGDDGILTALEISGMDLYGTELVVLSACETGVGEVKNGEGVYGLRRAFALAGAKNLMMSLWPVSDEVTASQMQAFYKNLQTMPPAEALRQAQLATIKDLKAKYGAAPPVLWAPFFLQGGQALGQ